MVSWWLLSQETGGLPTSLILVFVWGLETYHVGTFWCLASHAASSSVSYIYSAPWLHRFKKKSHFLGVFWQIPNVSKWYLCEFSTADPNCWDPVSLFFFKLLSRFPPTLSTCHKTKFPNKIWAWKNGANISCHFPYLYTRYELPKPGTSKRRSRSLWGWVKMSRCRFLLWENWGSWN